MNSKITLTTVLLLLLTASAYSQPYAGYTLYNPLDSRLTYLKDMDNETVHSWNNARAGGYSVYLTEAGNIIRPALADNIRLRGGATAGLIQETDWDGEIVWQFEYNTATYLTHHDLEPMPNGNVMAIAWEVKSAAQAQQAGREQNSVMWPDHIIEVAPDGDGGGEIVWEWHVWDHLIQDHDRNRDNYGVVEDHPELIDVNLATIQQGPGGGGDWLHINGISYNPDIDQIVISSHFVDEIFVIDHSTTTEEAASHEGGNSGMGGDILYRWGNPQNYGADGDQVFDVVHCSWWIPAGLPGSGNILVFNNGERARRSSVIEIELPIDENGMYHREDGAPFGPAEPVWTYSDGASFYSNHLGGCQRLPNGNTLISESTTGYLMEVNEDGDIVWDYDDRAQIARSLRYGENYPGVYRLNQIEEGVVVINEILVINDTTQVDQDGEFDGWIELYNNSDEGLSLSGFYLSGDNDNLTKWTFPDTSIEANSYLIVWADAEDQDGLHANFELMSRGGSLYFNAPDESALDDVEYGDQMADISYGRHPNGTGEFRAMTPTFAEENLDGIVVSVLDDNSVPLFFDLLQSYPNPFNSTTTIAYQLPKTGHIVMNVNDLHGKLVATLYDGEQSAGTHQVMWNAGNVPSGIYWISLSNGKFAKTQKTVLLR